VAIVIHGDTNLVGGRPTNYGDRRASLHVGWEDFAIFSKYGVRPIAYISETAQDRHAVNGELIGSHRRSIER